MKQAVRDPVQLCRVLELPELYHRGAVEAARGFPVFAPWEFIGRMRIGDPDDPLLRQVLPLAQEQDQVPGYTRDPVDDASARVRPGLLQKYPGRALLVTTSSCAIHCRYCFRRHFDYAAIPRSWEAWQPAIDQLAADASIEEVILSGGDPLMLPDRRLGMLLERLAAIPHLRRMRIHTRLPIVVPQRVTAGLVRLVRGLRRTTIVVVHANHPAELDEHVDGAVARLVDAGVPVLNQSVLLRGVNDSLETLVELSRRLVDRRVIPYYLHQFDQVQGAAHFEVPAERGRWLVEQMRGQMPGYAVPRLVREIPHRTSKTVLA